MMDVGKPHNGSAICVRGNEFGRALSSFAHDRMLQRAHEVLNVDAGGLIHRRRWLSTPEPPRTTAGRRHSCACPHSLALQRFEREAKTASSLNHPNICTIHEVDEADSNSFIVMEPLERETLRPRVAALAGLKRTLPLNELLDIAVQICTGLEAAHAKGIIHRDIKPANIFLSTSMSDSAIRHRLMRGRSVPFPAPPPLASDHRQRQAQLRSRIPTADGSA